MADSFTQNNFKNEAMHRDKIGQYNKQADCRLQIGFKMQARYKVQAEFKMQTEA